MKIATASSFAAGASMFGAFAITAYIGLYDTTLAQEDPLHHELTWGLGIITLIAGIILILKPRSLVWRVITGVVWPSLYLLSLGFDVQTKLCFGTNVHCWPSVPDSYDYLILNERVEGWVLSPYTSRTLIGFLLVTIFLVAASIFISMRSPHQASKRRAAESPFKGSNENSIKNSESGEESRTRGLQGLPRLRVKALRRASAMSQILCLQR
jgi:hypothetical protein